MACFVLSSPLRMLRRLTLLAALVLSAAPLRAQEPPAEQTLPPRAVVVPPVAWPASIPMPEDGFEALIVIGADGRAQLEACAEPREVCDALASALLEAEFTPAQRNAHPISSRVTLRFSTVPSSPSPNVPVPVPVPPLSPPTTPPPSENYGAKAVIPPPKPTAISLELAEMREVPGTFGDPFRVIDALPGVVPVMTGLPYVYVRGAPPGATAYFFDDIQLPALFHLALGPAVVHPAMVGPIDFYPGVAPARYGRRTGGTVAGQAAFRPLKPGIHGELELRLVDTQAYLAIPFGEGGRVEVAARYGYPGLLTKLFEPSSVVQYWDYQARATVPLSENTNLQLVALGSFDLIGSREDGTLERGMELQFHRFEARAVTRTSKGMLGYALGVGFERSGFGDDFDITSLRVGPKLWFDTKVKKARLRLGADMLASLGKITDPFEDEDDDEGEGAPLDNPLYQSANSRSVSGAYAELYLPLGEAWDLEAGLRGDVWITGSDAQKALEPRLLLRYRPHELVDLHAAFGLAYQPAVFLIPLPGLSDVALDRGLQRAIQSELGAGVDLPASFRLETKLFAHIYDDMLSFDAIDADDFECDEDDFTCEESDEFARMHALSYGAEFMVRRAFSEQVSGWLAYTLSKADAQSDGGLELTPSFDVRHVANLVFQWRISQGWHVAVRGYAQSGRFPLGASSSEDPRDRQRLPPFFRGDLQLSRLWKKSWGELRFTFDWLNFTFQKEPVGWDCADDGGLPRADSGSCQVEYLDFPITLPMLGVRATY